MKPFPLLNIDPVLRPHLKKVLDGEYDLHGYDFRPFPVVLDLGANQGSFAYWVQARYPGAYVHCYEPFPKNVEKLRANLTQADAIANVTITQAAVYPTASETVTFYESKGNAGMHSMIATMAGNDDKPLTVRIAHPQDLPDCDILKVDIEGPELEVIQNYLMTHDHKPTIIAFEYHDESTRRALDAVLAEYYYLHRAVVECPNIGTFIFLRRDVARERFGNLLPKGVNL